MKPEHWVVLQFSLFGIQLIALILQLVNSRRIKRRLDQIRGMSVDSEVAYATAGLRKEVIRLRKELRSRQ
jgi:hypothetical protein